MTKLLLGVIIFFLLSALIFGPRVSAMGSLPIALSAVYSKGDSKYDVVIKDGQDTTVVMYINDKRPSKATVTKNGWATFHKVKLADKNKISFTKIVKNKGKNSERPLAYVRYVQITKGKVRFVVPSDQDIIKAAVNNELKGKNNNNKNKLRAVDVVPQINGGYGVFIDYNADDNLSQSFIKKGIYIEMTKLYKILYTQTGKDVEAASVSAWFPMQDRFGNTSDEIVYKTILDKGPASQVNWNADAATLELQIMPGVWDTTLNLFQ
jgi:hypothetical protein